MRKKPSSDALTMDPATKKDTRIAPELKVGLYFCIFSFALAALTYVVC